MAATALLTLTGLASLTGAALSPWASAPSPPPPPAAGTGSGSTSESGPTPASGTTGPGAPLSMTPSAPRRVTIPSLGVSAPLVDLGRNPNGTLEVPSRPDRPGWYTGAPTPGALGPAVIAGHVTWNGEPSVFFRLGELRSGDRVRVLRADGSTAVFRITRLARFPKARFPTEQVYGYTDHAALRLITCGGAYLEDQSRYLDNVIAFGRLVDARAADSP